MMTKAVSVYRNGNGYKVKLNLDSLQLASLLAALGYWKEDQNDAANIYDALIGDLEKLGSTVVVDGEVLFSPAQNLNKGE
jgi:hypothetical protein